jgi:hypothetical protein
MDQLSLMSRSNRRVCSSREELQVHNKATSRLHTDEDPVPPMVKEVAFQPYRERSASLTIDPEARLVAYYCRNRHGLFVPDLH